MSGQLEKFASWWIHHIESPNPSDLLCERMEGRLIANGALLSGLACKTQIAINVETFLAALTDLRHDVQSRTDGAMPILHISCHGNTEGIGLSDETFLTWEVLGELLSQINEASQGKLILCMSTCEGFSGCRMAMTNFSQYLPFNVVIGPTEKVSWSDGAVAFAVLYHQLQKGANIVQAVEAMGVAAGRTCFGFWHGKDARDSYVASVRGNASNLGFGGLGAAELGVEPGLLGGLGR